MKIKASALTLILTLLFLFIAETLFVNSAVANPRIGGKPLYAKVSIESPPNGSENNFQLSFTVKTNFFRQSGLNYSESHCFVNLDSRSYEFKELALAMQTTISNDIGYDPYTELTLIGNTSLSNFAGLAKGNHTVEVKYGFYYAFPDKNYEIEFIVLSSAISQFSLTEDIALTPTPSPKPTPTPSPSPTIQNISSNIILDTLKETYKSTRLVVNFTVETNWSNYSFYYSLDQTNLKPAENVTVVSIERIPDAYEPLMNRTVLKGSCLLSNLSDGWHSITVYQIGNYRGNSQYGNNMNSVASQFFVDTQSTAQPSPTNNLLNSAFLTSIVIVFAVVVAVALVSLVYFKKRKR